MLIAMGTKLKLLELGGLLLLAALVVFIAYAVLQPLYSMLFHV